MTEGMQKKAAEIRENRLFTKRWQRVVSFVCALTVLGTVNSLILPAVAQQPEVFCGHEEHVHSAEAGCFEEIKIPACHHVPVLHTHSDSCYEERPVPLCGMEEGEGAHTHSAACYEERPVPLCGMEEGEGAHTHGDACYTERQELVCPPEPCEGHTHSDSCFETVRELLCGQEENGGHTHTMACYGEATEHILVCPQEESEGHVHTEACYGEEAERVPVCGLKEGQPEPHEHTEECYRTELVLICDKEVHTHTSACFSDPDADTETPGMWESSFAGVRLSGIWADDVLAIARTQLGYAESCRNYGTDAGGSSVGGYTRYGAWWGDPYAPWCATFCSFCLSYAGVDRSVMPVSCGCRTWKDALEARGLWHPAGSYTPEPGDLVFFDWDGCGHADHVGFVYEVSGSRLTTIEGNNPDVGFHSYEPTGGYILGYGELPENPAAPAEHCLHSAPVSDGRRSDVQLHDAAQTGKEE